MLGLSGMRRNRVLLVVVTLVLLLLLLYAARSELLPFGMGLFLAYILSPLVGWIERILPKWGPLPRINRVLSVLLVYFVVAAILATVAILFLPGFINTVRDFIDRIPSLVTRARETIQGWTASYEHLIPEEMRNQVDSTIKGIIPSIVSNVQKLVPQALGTIFQTFSFFLGLFALPIWLFFVLRDRDKLMESFYCLFPPGPRQIARDIVGIVDRVLGSYIRARLIMALVVGTMTSIGLMILNVKFAIVLGAVAGCAELVPIIGPFLGAIPAVIVVLATSPEKVIWIIVLFLVVQILENNLLDPVIQGEVLRLHPAIIIVSLVVASVVLGIWGMLIAVLAVALGREIFKYLYSRWSENGVMDSSNETEENAKAD